MTTRSARTVDHLVYKGVPLRDCCAATLLELIEELLEGNARLLAQLEERERGYCAGFRRGAGP